jgi:hypothetical protein
VLAVASMSTSWMVAETTQGSGKAINLAGSLRMQSWRMASIYQRLQQNGNPAYRADLEAAISRFESDLKASSILTVLPADETTPLWDVYRQVESRWHTRIKPGLLDLPTATATGAGVLDDIPAFVARINELVKQIEDAAEAKILVMRVILGARSCHHSRGGPFHYLVNNILVHPCAGCWNWPTRSDRASLPCAPTWRGKTKSGGWDRPSTTWRKISPSCTRTWKRGWMRRLLNSPSPTVRWSCCTTRSRGSTAARWRTTPTPSC